VVPDPCTEPCDINQVVTHKAQTVPDPWSGEGGGQGGEGFDRVLCDVPCSGDGTLRKDFKVPKP
jgi:16S rRNA C967 or C1407 C5-methylase (RsmB/RsmF family)